LSIVSEQAACRNDTQGGAVEHVTSLVPRIKKNHLTTK